MRLLLFGKTGQLAQELARLCPPGVEERVLGRSDADPMEPAFCAAAVLDSEADAVINAASWTAVNLAEAEEAAATIANGAAPGAMAEACAAKGTQFLQASTDYVFDGGGDAPFAPDDQAAPINAYGRSKLAGENAVRDNGARHTILRTSWVFSLFGNNILKSMLRLCSARERLSVVSDQLGGGLPRQPPSLTRSTPP
jgi:dTDP-4-dehydrorhamnose reductase